MKQFLSLFVVFTFLTINNYGQTIAISAALGGSAYYGELLEGIPTPKDVAPSFSLGGSYEISPQLRARGTISGLTIQGSDRRSTYIRNNQRNLDFSSFVWDVNLAAEYDLVNQSDFLIVPYIFAGPGIFGFNPTSVDKNTGKTVELQPLGTEGQGLAAYPDRKPYSLTQFNIGFGGGLKININDVLDLSGEVFIRYTFTDYLDDISKKLYVDPALFLAEGKNLTQYFSYRGNEWPSYIPYGPGVFNRGNKLSVDLFYTFQLKLTYIFGGRESDFYSSGNSGRDRLKCPRLVL